MKATVLSVLVLTILATAPAYADIVRIGARGLALSGIDSAPLGADISRMSYRGTTASDAVDRLHVIQGDERLTSSSTLAATLFNGGSRNPKKDGAKKGKDDKPDKKETRDEVHAVPEPASLTLLAVGAGSVLAVKLRRMRRQPK
jgi:hypothetical protein